MPKFYMTVVKQEISESTHIACVEAENLAAARYMVEAHGEQAFVGEAVMVQAPKVEDPPTWIPSWSAGEDEREYWLRAQPGQAAPEKAHATRKAKRARENF